MFLATGGILHGKAWSPQDSIMMVIILIVVAAIALRKKG